VAFLANLLNTRGELAFINEWGQLRNNTTSQNHTTPGTNCQNIIRDYCPQHVEHHHRCILGMGQLQQQPLHQFLARSSLVHQVYHVSKSDRYSLTHDH
jgi:hypothetical protein